MARITVVIEDLPEGGADIMEVSVHAEDDIDPKKMTPAEEMAALVMGLIEYARENAKNDSVSEVQEKN